MKLQTVSIKFDGRDLTSKTLFIPSVISQQMIIGYSVFSVGRQKTRRGKKCECRKNIVTSFQQKRKEKLVTDKFSNQVSKQKNKTIQLLAFY